MRLSRKDAQDLLRDPGRQAGRRNPAGSQSERPPPLRLEPGKLEIALSPDAPKSLVGDLSTRLKEWTGINWLVILSREAGKLTLVEEEAQQRERNFDDARADPDVAAILARFPGARVVNVVVHAEEQTDDMEAPAGLETPDDDE